MTRRRSFLAVLALACGALAVAAPVQAQAPAVAAAADLKFVMADLADAYQAATGRTVKLAFGSSGNFTQQIENGAPFELFLSADESYVGRLEAKGLTRGPGVLYAIGRLVLFVPAGSPLAHDGTLADLQRAITDGRLKRFAIANPEHAPYGRAAREALQAAGAWERIQPLLVLGENAVQATQFAAAGNAQGGLVPSSLAKAPEVARLGVAASVPDAMHRPLRQRMVLLKRATPAAEAFYAWLQSPPARSIFVRHGFALPGEG